MEELERELSKDQEIYEFKHEMITAQIRLENAEKEAKALEERNAQLQGLSAGSTKRRINHTAAIIDIFFCRRGYGMAAAFHYQEDRMVELLAPAGAPASLRAAVNAGADAVYRRKQVWRTCLCGQSG